MPHSTPLLRASVRRGGCCGGLTLEGDNDAAEGVGDANKAKGVRCRRMEILGWFGAARVSCRAQFHGGTVPHHSAAYRAWAGAPALSHGPQAP